MFLIPSDIIARETHRGSAGARILAAARGACVWGVCAWLLSGCSTVSVEPIATLPEEPPPFVAVPHPEGNDLGDLMAVFADRSAPSPSDYADCDKTFQQLRSKTQSREELERGVRELVRLDPIHYHWCFYSKLYGMEDGLRNDQYIDEKQKRVVETYLFLTPVAKGFMKEFSDSRYYRWAVVRYRKLSEYVFFRKLELSPTAANELMGASSTLGVQRRDRDPAMVLDKYGLNSSLPPGQLSVEALKAAASGQANPSLEDANLAPATASPAGVAPSGSAVEPIVVRAPAGQAQTPQGQAAPPPAPPVNGEEAAARELEQEYGLPGRADSDSPAKGAIMMMPEE